jgi:Na+/H+-dicarboxylate symporter
VPVDAEAKLVEVDVRCSDPVEHRRRIERGFRVRRFRVKTAPGEPMGRTTQDSESGRKLARELRPLKELTRYLQALVEGRLWVKVLLGLALGVGTGAALGPAAGLAPPETARTVTSWLALPGNLFIRLVQMIMVPLIVTSIIQGVAGGDNRGQLRTMGVRVGLYFVVTTAAAVLVGVALASLVQPGRLIDTAALGVTPGAAAMTVTAERELDVPRAISQLLPSNPLASMVSGEMLNVVIFAVITGIALASMTEQAANPLLQLLSSVQEICMTVTRWAMRLAPLAVFGLIAEVVARVGLGAITGLAAYVSTVVAALLALVALYAILLRSATDMPLGRFFRETREVLLLAFSVASSAAVMPLSLKTAEERLGVAPAVARFVIPVGATINMNGTAAYQAIATLFLAQVYGLDLNLMSIVLLVVTTVAASIGTPSTPGAGIVILATILTSIGIPVGGVALIIGVDSLLGMCRTAVNVMGDLTATLVFDHADGKRRALAAEAKAATAAKVG